ncbi:DUF6320 domain-containing protein [Xiamenia xianingshaonis]|uniref:Reverse gyrase n=2 Tax=Xiamenia xianingshaonis TaxID=2682776 RepID=A0ABX0ILX1_9ACTN|nr:DUF6320 domain-containing protein [Xiamenia xianingshaonis]NHM15012.1 reverse gyrase [Xiamenia xianingshaonis]
MRRCDACRVDFTGDLSECPLCGAALAGDVSPSPFPAVELQRRNTMARSVLLAVTAVLLVGVVLLGICFKTPPFAVAAACVAVAVNYLFVYNVLVRAPDFLRVLQRYFLVLVAMGVLGYAATGDEAFPTFVIPMTCLVGSSFDLLLLAVYPTRAVKDYAKYLLFFVVLGLAPLAFLPFGVVRWAGLVFVSALVAAVLGISLLVFEGRQMKGELKRLFHT